MRLVEHRRHAPRQPSGHLSREGVRLARSTGEGMGPFDLVVTSPSPRAVETAIAMGFAVDEVEDRLAWLPSGWEEVVPIDSPFALFAAAARRGGLAAEAAAHHAGVIREVAGRLRDGGRALVVSHGGILEVGTVGCLPDDDAEVWGAGCGYCDGVRLVFEGDRCTLAEIVRARRPA